MIRRKSPLTLDIQLIIFVIAVRLRAVRHPGPTVAVTPFALRWQLVPVLPLSTITHLNAAEW